LKRQALYINVSLFIISLMVGVSIGGAILPAKNLAGSVNGLVTSQFVTLPNGQRSLFTIVVDDVTLQKPQLQSVWMVMYLPQDARLTLMPVYTPGDSRVEKDLQDTFSLHKTGEVVRIDPEFMSMLEAMDLWWSGYIIVDQIAIRQLLAGSSSSTTSNISTADVPFETQDQSAQVFTQLNNHQKMCRSLLVGWDEHNSHISPVLMELMSTHILVSFDQSQLLTELHIFERYGSNLVCDSPAISALSQVRR
jgi:hypothetical protein